MKKHISTTTGLLIILAAAVLIGGGALTYFYIKSPTAFDLTVQSPVKVSNKTASATKDWKTYTNSTYKFSLKYPKDMTTQETNNESTLPADQKIKTYVIYFTDIASSNNLKKGYDTFQVSVYKNISNYNLEQASKYLAHNNADVVPDDQLTGYSNKISYTLGGIEGIRGNDGCCGTVRDNVLVIKGDYIYIVNYIVSSGDSKTNLDDTFNSMLSTFQFTQ